MKDIYKEEICRSSLCPFAGIISEPVLIAGIAIKYIDCQRDNEGAKDYYLRTLKDNDDQWCRQEVNFQHCLFSFDNTKSWCKLNERHN